MFENGSVFDRSLKEWGEIIFVRGSRYLVRYADDTRIWRDVDDLVFYSRLKWLSFLRQKAAEVVMYVLERFRTPFVVRALATSYREDEQKIVFSVFVQFKDTQGLMTSIIVPVVYDKKSGNFLEPRLLYWNGMYTHINQGFFDRLFRRVPRDINFNKFSPFAPQILRFVEGLL
jgi:hypothetical protein